jgi:hypothetical protein
MISLFALTDAMSVGPMPRARRRPRAGIGQFTASTYAVQFPKASASRAAPMILEKAKAAFKENWEKLIAAGRVQLGIA